MAENKVPAGNSVALPQFPVMRPADGSNTSPVRLGGMGPVFPAVIVDAGKIRLGGMSPLI